MKQMSLNEARIKYIEQTLYDLEGILSRRGNVIHLKSVGRAWGSYRAMLIALVLIF